jgi:alkylated DNA repair dioxygenase AlkB
MQMLLIDPPDTKEISNLLSKDGCVQYYPKIWDQKQCALMFDVLLQSLNWETDQLVMFGEVITTKRKVVWVGDEGRSYTYSGVKKHPSPWTTELLAIKTKLEELAQWKFNSCLLNLYHNGSEGMGWHSDNEPELNPKAPIASLSLGEIRKFAFRHKIDKTVSSVFLENGSVLMMHAPTQASWQHSLLKTAKPVGPRINLTFRDIR